jgi:hypothetical protein
MADLDLHVVELMAKHTRGNMELFPISSGGGQFTFVPLTLWYKFATRGCRWIPYSNCQSNPSMTVSAGNFIPSRKRGK